MKNIARACCIGICVFAAGQALAQTGVEVGRVSRHCTGATLNTDPAAPCADDVLRDRVEVPVVRSPGEPLPPATPVGAIQPIPGSPVTSGGTTPGAPMTSGGTTPGVGANAAGTTRLTPGSPARTTN